MSDPWDVYDQIEELAFWRDRHRGPCFDWRPFREELSLSWRALAGGRSSVREHPSWVPNARTVARRWPEDWS